MNLCEKLKLLPEPAPEACVLTALVAVTGREDWLANPNLLHPFNVDHQNIHNIVTLGLGYLWIAEGFGNVHLHQKESLGNTPEMNYPDSWMAWMTARHLLISLPSNQFTYSYPQLELQDYGRLINEAIRKEVLIAALINYPLWNPTVAAQKNYFGNELIICDYQPETTTVTAFEPSMGTLVHKDLSTLFNANTALGQQLIFLKPPRKPEDPTPQKQVFLANKPGFLKRILQ